MQRLPPLAQKTQTDVVIVGGGMAGLSCAQVLSEQGRHLGTIPTGRVINNLAFAGQDKKLLYLVGRGAAWKIRMIAKGYKGRAK